MPDEREGTPTDLGARSHAVQAAGAVGAEVAQHPAQLCSWEREPCA